jgi:plasmid stability protein
MADILIRDVPDEVVTAIDARAKRQGLSRTEYLRRALVREATPTGRRTAIEDLRRFSELAQDLKDDEIMRRAWE